MKEIKLDVFTILFVVVLYVLYNYFIPSGTP